MSIKLCSDGRVLIHCFAGCDIEAICDSLGLRISDLMPESINIHRAAAAARNRMPARDALIAIDHEALVVAIIAADVGADQEVDAATWDRLAQSVARISAARDACCPARHRR